MRIIRELKDPLAKLNREIPQKEWAKAVRSAHSDIEAEIKALRKKLEAKNKDVTKVISILKIISGILETQSAQS